MTLTDLFQFQNPEVVAVVAGVLVFVLAFTALKNFDKSVRMLISIVLGLVSGFYLYRKWLYESSSSESTIIGIIIIIVIVILFLKIGWSFVKGTRHNFR